MTSSTTVSLGRPQYRIMPFSVTPIVLQCQTLPGSNLLLSCSVMPVYKTPPGSGVPLFWLPHPKLSVCGFTGRTSFPPTVLTWPSCGAACFLSMNIGFRPSLSSCLNNISGLSLSPRHRSWSPCTMYKAYCRQSAVMLYFLSATGSTL